MNVRITPQGYLHIPAALARQHFPQDVLVALVRGRELWLLPLRGGAAGGLLLKQRNPQGDRSVLIWEVLPPDTPPGECPAFWDERQGALRVALPQPSAPAPPSEVRHARGQHERFSQP